MVGNILKSAFEARRVGYGMALPAFEGMFYCRTESGYPGGYRHIAYSPASELPLKQGPQVGCQDIAFDKGIAEIGDTHRSAQGGSVLQGFVKCSHSQSEGIGIIFNAGHAGLAGIYKYRLCHNRQRDRVGIGNFFHNRIGTQVGQQIDFAQGVPFKLTGGR